MTMLLAISNYLILMLYTAEDLKNQFLFHPALIMALSAGRDDEKSERIEAGEITALFPGEFVRTPIFLSTLPSEDEPLTKSVTPLPHREAQ